MPARWIKYAWGYALRKDLCFPGTSIYVNRSSINPRKYSISLVLNDGTKALTPAPYKTGFNKGKLRVWGLGLAKRYAIIYGTSARWLEFIGVLKPQEQEENLHD